MESKNSIQQKAPGIKSHGLTFDMYDGAFYLSRWNIFMHKHLARKKKAEEEEGKGE